MPDPVRLNSLADRIRIAPGVEMNRLGIGTYKASEGPDVEGEIAYGLSVGYRTVDTAALYANERTVGDTIRASGIPRDEVFVTTKVWNTDQGYAETLSAFDASIDRLGFDYVDLYLIHWPLRDTMRGTWKAMEEIQGSGRTRAIGVCNFLPHHLDTLLSFAEVPPAVNQFEHHVRLQQPELVDYCLERGITVQAWAPIMRGRVMLIPELVQIAQVHGKSPAQVSIRWILQRGLTTIPKSIHANRILENSEVYDFELSEAEMAIIESLDRGERLGPDPDRRG
jgi:diketogulonate reductase-like aldo/keto reductase